MDAAGMTVDSQNWLTCKDVGLSTIHSPYSHY